MTDLAQGMLDMLGGGSGPPPNGETQEKEKGPPKPNAVQAQVEADEVQAEAAETPAPVAPKAPPVPRPRADVAKAEAEARKEEAKTKREEVRASTKTTKLSKLVGSGEIVKLYKREGGERAKVGNYTERDLEGYSDLEDFVWEHIRPTWGYGTYEIVYIDARGTSREGPEIRFAAPTTGPNGVGAGPSIGSASGIGIKDLRQAEKDGEERIRKLMDEVKRSGGSDALAASVMEMLRQQQQQTLQMMQEQVTAAQRRAADRPAPPPPPPVDTTGAEAIKALSSIVTQIMTRSEPTRDDSHEKMLAFMKEDRERERDRRDAEETRRREEDRERVRREDEREKQRMELEKTRLEYETKQREKDREHQLELAKLSKTGDALGPLEQAAKAIEAADKIRGNNGMTGMDALGMFIENADSIAEKIGGIIAAGRAAQKDGGGAGKDAVAKPKKIGFPETITPLVDDMKRGARDKDARVMVEAVVKSIGALGNDPRWARAAKSLLMRIGQADKENALKEMELFLQKLMEADEPLKMEEDTARAVMGALEENWEAIMEAASAFVQTQKKG